MFTLLVAPLGSAGATAASARRRFAPAERLASPLGRAKAALAPNWRKIAEERRGFVFVWIDRLGKWCARGCARTRARRRRPRGLAAPPARGRPGAHPRPPLLRGWALPLHNIPPPPRARPRTAAVGAGR